jgi:hypothetical protein
MLAEMRSLSPGLVQVHQAHGALLLEVRGHFLLSVFDRMRATFSADELAELGRRVIAVKQHSPAFPDEHPCVVADR